MLNYEISMMDFWAVLLLLLGIGLALVMRAASSRIRASRVKAKPMIRYEDL